MAWLVVGLGNPGSKYERNRHNIGFRVVDELVRKHGLSAFKKDATSGMIPGGGKVYLLKPQDYMNRSGFATQRAAQFHDVAIDNILVVHDEVDLPFGTIRLKAGGGHGGHNGLRSLVDQLGGNGFARVRMGVGRDPNLPPGKQGDTAGWVLGDFPSAQADAIDRMLAAACEDIEAVLARGIVPAMNAHNARPPVG